MPHVFRVSINLLLCLFCTGPLAATVYVSPLFTDHMVIQRDAPIHFWGTCTNHEKITVTFAGVTGTAKLSGTEWEAVLPPMPAGGPYTLTISCKENTIHLTNVLIGDVWICAGQSNMRFKVDQAFDADMTLLQCNNSLLRLSDWQGSLNPINQRYPLSFLQQLTPSNFFSAKEWKAADSASVHGFSAVGYFFGKNLQQATQLPIGLINNAVGGVPAETYIPIQALAADPVLSDLSKPGWLTNPLYPVWTAERVMQNLISWKEEAPATVMPQHPYQPGFLFDAAIAPLKKMAFKGVVWYQGESNATFTADSSSMDASLNKRKLKLLINSWREELSDPSLPFIIIQLPTTRRDWEQYREVQMDIAKELNNVSLVVTLDLGHATDVHPRNKKTVGERAARAALANVYGKKLNAGGPLIQSFRMEGKYAVISFSNASSGLSTGDGEPLRNAFICGVDKKFYPAKAQFKKNELWLFADEVATAVAARYAWEDDPFHANLINNDGLPAAPFRTDK